MAGGTDTSAGGAIYCLGILGALFWFWQQANGFWEHVWSLVQALTWPAWMVFEAFERLYQ